MTLDALIDPRVFGIEVQLPPQKFYDRKAKKTREHCFDLRLTFEDDFRRAVFVRNGYSFTKTQTKDEIADIFSDLSADFADDAIVVDGDAYTRSYRHNLYRVWDALQPIDHDADVKIEEAASSTCYWSIKDLIRKSTLPSPRAFAAILRLVGRGGLAVDWYSVICVHSRVLLKA